MKLYAAIMLGGALGSAARFAVSVWLAAKVGESFPWGTFAVNVIGSFVIGFFVAITGPDGAFMVSPAVRAFVAIGLLGGFTTFSSFSIQTFYLMQDGQWLWAAGNVVMSVVFCLLAAGGGVAAANILPLRS
jgi:CrcB protein